MRLDTPTTARPESPLFVEPLEGRLCLSTTHHLRHHFHLGVRARFGAASTTASPPAVLSQLGNGSLGTTGLGSGLGTTGLGSGTGTTLFGGSGGGSSLFGGSGMGGGLF